MPEPLSSLKVDRGLLSDQIYEMIKQMIRSATLAPGEQLVESALARQLEVSQAPVREALKQLAHEGLVTHVRHQGNFVAQHSDADVAQARVARGALEDLAGRLAVATLDEDTEARLTELIGQLHAAADAADLDAFRERDFDFHRAVIESTGNVHLPKMWDVLEPTLRTMHLLDDPTFAGDWHDVADWHAHLLEVLRAGDAEAAGTLFRRHATNTLDQLDAG